MNIQYFTSMDLNYHNHCGRAMLESFNRHFKKRTINLYNEDGFVPMVDRINLLGWELGYEYRSFQRRWATNNKRVTQFAKKGFSIIHAMNNLDADRIVWLDADSIVKSVIPDQLIEILSNDDVLSTHFGVRHQWDQATTADKHVYSCETGFFILNKNHPMFNRFRDVYTDIYVNDKCKDLRRFYDGEVYGKTVEILHSEGAKILDLNPLRHKTPIPRSVMAPYIEHYKAGVKENLTNEILEERFDLK